ncbi:MAG: glycoside hydrolase family 32 protein [Chloroflexota bacterium]|nr:glycoside hydrolase family 32 protein [Chloroflexota bacterium]
MNTRHRTHYHFQPAANWINDPNGLIHHRGTHHLFFQHNPDNPWAERIHWGHARSENLIDWQILPIALSPGQVGADPLSCYSGCAVSNDGQPVIIYTGVAPERACVAFGNEDLSELEKYGGNPVIAGPPRGLTTPGFRDHSVWREDGGWRMIIGSGESGRSGLALGYRSPDLLGWEYDGVFASSIGQESSPMWECPDFFTAGGRDFLVVSMHPDRRVFYYTAPDHGRVFEGAPGGRVDLGQALYAPQSYTDQTGRRIMFGWLQEERPRQLQVDAGWSGAQSLPRVLGSDRAGRLVCSPAPEVDSLRISATPDWREPGQVSGDRIEIIARFSWVENGVCGLSVLDSGDGLERTEITYGFANDWLTLDASGSSLEARNHRTVSGGRLHLPPGEDVELRLFVDASVVEVFANGRAGALRAYPELDQSIGTRVISRIDDPGIPVREADLDNLTGFAAWRLREASPGQ